MASGRQVFCFSMLLATIVVLVGLATGATASSNSSLSLRVIEQVDASRATGDGCQDLSAVCIPDGSYTITATNSNPAACRFSVTIKWGDGATDKFTIGPSRDVTHQYKKAGVYTIKATGEVAAVLQQGATCTGASGSFKVEYPLQADKALTKTLRLAEDVPRDNKLLHKAKHKKRKRKLQTRAVNGIVGDAQQAKRLKKQFKKLGVPKKGDLLVPCPTKRVTRGHRGCTGEVVEKAQDLWGFLGALEKLTNYPKYARKRADQWYENSAEGRHTLDKLAWLKYGGRDPHPGDYKKLSNEQKTDIAIQAQVYDGAINRALRDAQKAGRAGAELEF